LERQVGRRRGLPQRTHASEEDGAGGEEWKKRNKTPRERAWHDIYIYIYIYIYIVTPRPRQMMYVCVRASEYVCTCVFASAAF